MFTLGKHSKNKYPEILVRYFISSANLIAKKLSSAMKSHSNVGNKLHCRLDMAIKEDNFRLRKGNARELIPEIRHIVAIYLSKK
ncbi:hypothetical protein ACSP9K_002277 [Citrobacter werkmanii]